MPGRSTNKDPLKVFRFLILMPDYPGAAAGFRSASGLEITSDVIDYRDSDKRDMVQKHPGLQNSSTVTLTRGQFLLDGGGGVEMKTWFQTVCPIWNVGDYSYGSDAIRQNLVIVQLTRTGYVGYEWTLIQAWPQRFKPFSDLDSLTSENSIEELELANEGIEMGNTTGATALAG